MLLIAIQPHMWNLFDVTSPTDFLVNFLSSFIFHLSNIKYVLPQYYFLLIEI